MTKSPRVTLVLTAGGRGGNGKTTALVALTDYLASKGIKQTLIDCDTENAGQPACFSHWLHGKGNALDSCVKNLAHN
jgi:MinD-like ATPase involved in chromosome partitioning or flagellar assembly